MLHRLKLISCTPNKESFVSTSHSFDSEFDVTSQKTVLFPKIEIDLESGIDTSYTHLLHSIKKENVDCCSESSLDKKRSTGVSQTFNKSSVREDCTSVYNYIYLDDSSTESSLDPLKDICSFNDVVKAEIDKNDSLAKTDIFVKNQNDNISESFICAVQDQFLISTQHVEDKPKNSQHVEDKPKNSQHVEDKSVSTKCVQDTLSSTQHIRERTSRTQHVENKSSSTKNDCNKKSNTHHVENTPSSTQHIRDRPSQTQHVEDKPKNTQHVEDKPRNTQHVEDKPRNTQHVEDKPANTQHVEDKSVSTKLVKDTSSSTQHIRDRPSRTQHVEHKPSQTQHVEHKPSSIKHNSDKKRNTQHVENTPSSTQHIRNRPSQTQHVEHKPSSIKHDSDKKRNTQHVEDKPRNTQHVENTASSTQLVEDKPSNTQLVEDDPQNTKHVEDKPSSIKHDSDKKINTQHVENTPSSPQHIRNRRSQTQHVEHKPSSIKHDSEKKRNTQHVEDKPRNTQHVEDTASSTQLVEDKPSNTQLVEDNPQNTKHVEDKPSSIKHDSDKKINTQHVENTPSSSQHIKDRPSQTQHVEDKPSSIKHDSDKIRNTQHVEDKPRNTQHVENTASSTQLVEDKPSNTQLVEDKPKKAQYVEDKQRNTQHVEDKSSYTQHVENEPRNTLHVEDKPRNTQHVEENPQSTKHVEDKSNTAQHIEDKPRNTQQNEDKPKNTQHVEDKSSRTQHVEDKTRNTQFVEDKSRNTQHIEDKSSRTQHVEKCSRPQHAANKPNRQPAQMNISSSINVERIVSDARLQPVHWRQATHGFVCEHSRSLQRNSSYIESQTRISQAWFSTSQERSDGMLGHVPWDTPQNYYGGSKPPPHMLQNYYGGSQPAPQMPYNYSDPQLTQARHSYQDTQQMSLRDHRVHHNPLQDHRVNHNPPQRAAPVNYPNQFTNHQEPSFGISQENEVQQSIHQMTDYPRQGKRYYPFEESSSSPPKFHRGHREWTPPSVVPYHNLSQNPHQVPPFPSSLNEHVHHFPQIPHSFNDHSSYEIFPYHTRCPPLPCPPQWNSWNRCDNMSLSTCYQEQQSISTDNFNHQFNTHFPQKAAKWGQTHEWQSRWRDQYRAKGNQMVQWNDRQKKSAFRGKDSGTGRSKSVNRRATIIENQNPDNSKPVGGTNIAENLRLFIEKLKTFPAKESSVQTIENCITASNLPINTLFVVDKTLPLSLNPAVTSGALYINDVFIARSNSDVKDTLKHKVYDVALQLLMTKSVECLMAQDNLQQTPKNLPLEATFVKDEVGPDTKDGLRGKLSKLKEYMMRSKCPQNQPIMVFEMALIESQCQLNHRFDFEQIRTEKGIHMYTKARVLIDGKTVAHAAALNKKESKTRACQKAVSLFTSTDIDTIFKEYFESEKADKELIVDFQELIKQEGDKQKVSKKLSAVIQLEQEECLDRLIRDLKLPVKDGVSTVMTVDKNCVQMKMKLLAIYKIAHSPGQQIFITCDLYILDHFLAQGKASTRKMAQADAYSKGGEILKKSTGADVLSAFPKFSEEELNKPDVMEIVYKGYSKVYESNRCRLNRLKQLPEEQRKVSQLVIIEHKDWAVDRKKHSHCILNQSATQCGCLLEWTTEPENGCFRCTMKLQGEEISSVLTKQRKTAVGMASSVALFNLYETQPVVQGFPLDYPKVWISRDELMRYSQSHAEDCQTALNEQAKGNEEVVDTNISRAMQQMLDQFFSRSTLEDFVGAPDWKPEEKKLLRILAIARGLRVVTDVYCEERLTVISRKYDLSEMVKILENQANKNQGRYRLLPQEEKPSYNDIAGEVAANESIVEEYQTLIGLNERNKPLLEAMDVDEEAVINNYVDSADVSLNSEDCDAFITADSSFFNVTDVKDKLKVEITQMLEMPLPTRTSTPTKAAADIESYSVDEPEIPKTTLTTSGECNRSSIATFMSSALAESSLITLTYLPTTSATSVSAGDKEFQSPTSSVSSALPTTVSSDFQAPQLKEALGQSPAYIHGHSLTDLEGVNSSRTNTHPQVKQSHLTVPQSHQNKLERSIDLEAGMNVTDHACKDQWEQWWSPKQDQQQWVEQEQYKNYYRGSVD